MTQFKEFYAPQELLDMMGFDLIPFNGTGDEDLPEPEEGEVTPTRLNPDLPVETLSPPILRRPVFACAKSVAVTGTLKGATVRVLSGSTVIAEGVSRGGDISFDVKPLKEGERLAAQQEFDGRTSPDSFPVTVMPHPKQLPQPQVVEAVYECGRFVVVDHCLPGSTVKLIVDGSEVRSGTARGTRIRLYTKGAFRTGQVVQAVATLCEGVHDAPLKSDLSPSVTVTRAPRSLPQPDIDMDSITLGNDRIVVRDCLYNAGQSLTEGQTPWRASYGSTSAAAWFLFPAGQEVKVGDVFVAQQRLCVDSPPSPKITVEDDPRFKTLSAPEIQEPICPGERIIAVKGCRPGAVVAVVKSNQAIAVTTAGAETCWLAVGDPSGVKAGDSLFAVQYINSIVSPPSKQVTVQPTGAVAIQIGRNGIFVDREGEAYQGLPEQFSRLIRIRAKTCCTDLDEGEPITARLLDTSGSEVAKVPLASYGNGLYEGLYAPDGGALPPGDYTLEVETPCNGGSDKLAFKVVITTPDASDTTPPKVSMHVRAQDGGRASLSSAQASPASLDVFLGEFLNVTAVAEDPEGLMALNAQTSAGRVIGSRTYSNRGTTPIPVKETLSFQIVDLPLGTARMSAEAQNYGRTGNMAKTPDLTVNVKQRRPVLSEVYSKGKTLILRGGYLHVRGEPTVIALSQNGALVREVPVPTGKLSPGLINEVSFPAGLKQGAYEVSVKVGAAKLESNAVTYFMFWGDPMVVQTTGRIFIDATKTAVGSNVDHTETLSMTVNLDSSVRTASLSGMADIKVFIKTDHGDNTTTATIKDQPISGTFDPLSGKVTATMKMRLEHSLALANLLGGGSDLSTPMDTGQSVSHGSTTFAGMNIDAGSLSFALVGKSALQGGLLGNSPTMLTLSGALKP